MLAHPLTVRHQQPTRTANQTTKHNHFRDVNKMVCCASRARFARPRSDACASSHRATPTANENSQQTHHAHDAGWGLAQPLRPLRPQPAITGARALSGLTAPGPGNPLAANRPLGRAVAAHRPRLVCRLPLCATLSQWHAFAGCLLCRPLIALMYHESSGLKAGAPCIPHGSGATAYGLRHRC